MRILAVLLLGFLPLSAAAEITLRIEWALKAPLSELQSAVKEGVALQKKINPKVQHELWVNDIHGDGVASASLIVFYEDLAHYAMATQKEEADPNWQAFIASFPEEKFPTTWVGISEAVIPMGPDRATAGDVMSITVFNGAVGMAELAEQVNKGKLLQDKINPQAVTGMSMTLVAGETVGGAAVLQRYGSLVEWAQGEERSEANAQWTSFVQAFPVAKFPIVYQGLSRAVAID